MYFLGPIDGNNIARNTSQMFQITTQCVNQMALCRFLWVVRKLWTILNLQKHRFRSPLSKTYMNYEFSLTLVNLKIMSLERVSENKKKCEIGTLKYGLLRIRKNLDLGLH